MGKAEMRNENAQNRTKQKVQKNGELGKKRNWRKRIIPE